MKTSDNINELVDAFFDFFSNVSGNFASNIAPLLAGVLPAYLTYKHIVEVLMFDTWVAWAGAGVVEFLGLGAGTELMKVWNHNRRYKDAKAKMPMLAPGSAAGWYVVIMIVFNIILEAQPNSTFWKIVSVALFATLAIPGYALVAGKTLRKEWESEHEKTLSERRSQSKPEQDRARAEQGGEDRENDPNSPLPEEQTEYASAYSEQIESILERVWSGTGKVASPAYIIRALNENGANLDPRKSSGYVSTLSKNWRIANGIQVQENGNGRHAETQQQE